MKVFIDTNVLIYLLEGSPDFGHEYAALLTNLKADGAEFCTSTTTITEFLASNSDPKALSLLSNFPGLSFRDLDVDTAEKAGELARNHHMKLGDSIQLATAITAGCETLITHDASLQKTASHYVTIVSL